MAYGLQVGIYFALAEVVGNEDRTLFGAELPPHGKDQPAEVYLVLGHEPQVRQRVDHQAVRLYPADLGEDVGHFAGRFHFRRVKNPLLRPLQDFVADFHCMQGEKIGVEVNIGGFCQRDKILSSQPDGDVEAALTVPDPFGDELERKGRLPGPGSTGKEVHLLWGQSSQENVVKTGNARGNTL